MNKRTVSEINEKIKSGNAVVFTKEEVLEYAKTNGVKKTFEHVDVVTTGTFGAMCSSGAFINFGHADPPMRMEKVFLNDVSAYAGVAAVDAYIGATQESEKVGMEYGGAHVIHEFIKGEDIKIKALAKGTDCYPRTEIKSYINKFNVNQAYMFSPRNGYQNYPAATNSSDRVIKTYMGALLPRFGNVSYSTAGEYSPLINDPFYRTVGIGTKVFFGGTQGFVAWEGTQHAPSTMRNEKGIPVSGAGTLALIGDLKKMDPRYIKPAVFDGYGVSMFVGFGLPIPIIDEDMLLNVLIENKDIHTSVMDYSVPHRNKPVIRKVTYEELRSGKIELNRKKVQTNPMSSLKFAKQIATELKIQIEHKEFLLTSPVEEIPKEHKGNALDIREARV